MVKTSIPGLYVLPAGPSLQNPSDLLSVTFANLLERVSRDFDLVFVDGPPMLGFAETSQLASLVDAVIVVAKAESTTGKAIAETIASLLRVRARIFGVVMNNVKSSSNGYGYYYSSEETKKEIA
jgi:Mrp family chromosome partitioning ATPase